MDKDIMRALRFVRGAVSTKNLIPELKHFAIRNGHVRGFNGSLALSSPIDFDIDCAPRAVDMVNAINNCSDTVSLGITEKGHLRIKSGPYKVYLGCLNVEDLPDHEPQGDIIEFDGAQMLEAIEALSPFMGNDASRPWTNGVFLQGQSAFVTNNVCFAQYWIGSKLPFDVNVPAQALKEMTRIGEPPTHAQVSPHSITFHYKDRRWVRSQLLESEPWAKLPQILEIESAPVAVPAALFDGLAALKPFMETGNRVYFAEGEIRTANEKNVGASYEVEGLHPEGIYNIKMLSLLGGVATHADFAQYPAPVPFFGGRLRGLIMGQR